MLERDREVELHERKNRERLAKSTAKLFEHWGLSAADQAMLLGLSPDSRATLARYRRGERRVFNARCDAILVDLTGKERRERRLVDRRDYGFTQ